MKPVTDPSILEQLNASSGMKPVQDPALLAQLNGEPQRRAPAKNKDNAIKQGFGMVKDFFQGDDEFEEAGNIQDYINTTPRKGLNKEGFGLALSSMFGNDDDLIKRFKEYNPDANIQKDDTGNSYVEKEGEKFYFNKGGVDVGDALDVAGEAGSYIGGGLATAPVKGLMKRSAATGGIETGINVINQKLAGRDDINKTEAAIAGLGGAAFEGLTPIFSAIVRKVKGAGVSNKEAGRIIADEMGQDLTETQMVRLGQYAKKLDFDQVDKGNIARHVELDQTPTKGTATGDQNILDYENQLRNSGGYAQKRLEGIDQQNTTALNRKMEGLQSGRNVDDYQAADNVLSNVVKAEKQAKQATNEAYGAIDKAYASIEPFKELPQRIKKSLSDSNVILDPDNVPKANIALKSISKSLGSMGDSKAVSWGAVDQQRKKLNTLFAGASSEDRRALTILKNQYDDTAFDAFENSLFSGDPEVVKKLSNARGVATDYFKKFSGGGKNDPAGRVIDKWLNADMAPEQVADAVVNVHGNFKANSPQMAKRYLEIVGKGTPEAQDFKDMVLGRMTKKLGEPKTRQALRGSLRKSLMGNRTMIDEVFTKKEQGFLSRTLQYLDETSLSGDKARSSGTTERFMRWMDSTGEADLSLNGIRNAVKKLVGTATGARNRQFNLPTQQYQTPLLPASGAMGSQLVTEP